MWNLAPLCDGHHVADHLGLLKISGRAPFDLTFEWMSPPMKPACLPPELAMVVGDDVPAGTPGLDPALMRKLPGSSQRWAAAVARVVPAVVARDAEPGSTCASRRADDVPAGTRDSPPGEGSVSNDEVNLVHARAHVDRSRTRSR
jgi:hypothetical protein